jgi:predicted enzyme related to lactoylglutathione lyase
VDDHITVDAAAAAARMIDDQGGQVVEEEDKLELTGWITQTKLFILCQAFVGAS